MTRRLVLSIFFNYTLLWLNLYYCQYPVVFALHNEPTEDNVSMAREALVLSTACFHSFGIGILLAFPSNLNAAILSPNSTDIRATTDEASWIASVNGFTGLLSFLIFSPLFQVLGRKPVSIIIEILITFGWFLILFSKSVTMLIIAKSIQGISMAGLFLGGLTVTEFTNGKNRGIFMTMMKAFLACGSLVCHSLALTWDWRQVAAVAYIPNVISLLLVTIRPESPAFYAMNGQFGKCEEIFIRFHGDTPDSRLELNGLISAQMERLKQNKQSKEMNLLQKVFKELSQRNFQMPFIVVALATVAVEFSGRYFILGYITQIMMELIGNKDVGIYCSMATDCLLIIALLISSIIIKTFNRRTILFGFGGVSVALMFVVELSMLMSRAFSVKTMWITPLLILSHSFISHIGLVPVAFTISTEMFPLNQKGLGSLTTGANFTLFYAFTMKMTPFLIRETGIGSTYFIYGIGVAICLSILYFILPETKDKALHEIEDDFILAKRTAANTELSPLN